MPFGPQDGVRNAVEAVNCQEVQKSRYNALV